MPALLERDAQRAELGELLRDLALGHGALVLVEGPAGIGKTEVLHLPASMAPSLRPRAVSCPHTRCAGCRRPVFARGSDDEQERRLRVLLLDEATTCDHGQGGGCRWGRST